MNLTEMNVEQLEARQAELAGMEDEGTTEELEARADEIEAIRNELQKRANAAAENAMSAAIAETICCAYTGIPKKAFPFFCTASTIALAPSVVTNPATPDSA